MYTGAGIVIAIILYILSDYARDMERDDPAYTKKKSIRKRIKRKIRRWYNGY